MLTATLNGRDFHFDESVSVRLEWYNPFFSFDEFRGDRGLNLDIPVNDQNRALLGNPERFERQTTTSEYSGFELRFGGWYLMSGTLIVQDATDKTYSCYLRGTVGTIGKAYREKNINELTNVFKTRQSFTNKATYVPGTDDYCCPAIFNPIFFEGIGKNMPNEEVGVLDYQFRNGDSAGYVNARNLDGTVLTAVAQTNITTHPEDLKVTAVCPMLFSVYVLKALLKGAGYDMGTNALETDLWASQLAVYSTYDITKMTYFQTGGWFTINWLDEAEVKAKAKVFDTLWRDYSGTFDYATLLPKIPFKDFVIGLQNLTNLFIHFKSGYLADVLSRETILVSVAIDIERYRLGRWKISEKKDVTLKFEYEPDDDDLIFSERYKSIDDRRDDIGEAVDDWTDLESISSPEVGEIRYIKNADVYAEYKWVEKIAVGANNEETKTNMLGWEHLSIGFQNGWYNYGKDEKTVITSKISGVYTGTSFFGLQTALQRGNMGSLKYAFQNFAPRLASNIGNLFGNLQWDGETGIITRRYQVTAPFLSSLHQVTSDFAFPANVLDYMIRNLPYKFRTREGEFLIEKMETEFSYNELSTTTITAYKV
jgi:hypothetical protein